MSSIWFCRFDSTRILFTGYGEVPRLVASLLQADTLETRPAASAGTMGSPSPVAAIRAIVPFASISVGWNSRAWRMAAPV